jgi:hypothetical protein
MIYLPNKEVTWPESSLQRAGVQDAGTADPGDGDDDEKHGGTYVMAWFGESWGAPICEETSHEPTPVGVLCMNCEERIEADDRGVITPQLGLDETAVRLDPAALLFDGQPRVAQHLECHLRGVFGSVGHIEGRCSCAGGNEEDPPGLSRREAAVAAVAAWERRYGSRVL